MLHAMTDSYKKSLGGRARLFAMQIKKCTPILIVDAIEPNLRLWIDQLGYEKTVEVPHGDRLGFVILQRSGLEIMLQTEASLRDDVPQAAKHLRAGSVALYSDVDSIDEAKKKCEGLEVLVPERTTPYGAREIFVRARDGQVLGFAQF
jgi:hypothetical protein